MATLEKYLQPDEMKRLGRVADHDSTIRAKLVQAHSTEPLLQAAAVLDADVRDFLRKGLDPHAT